MNTDLTANELAAALALVSRCLRNMGGTRPADLDNDPFTWVESGDLIAAGWTRHAANGTFGTLMGKGFIDHDGSQDWSLSVEAYRWLDTVWDGR